MHTVNGELLCLVNLLENSVTYTKYLPCLSTNQLRAVAPDSSYFVEFEKLASQQQEMSDEFGEVEFSINSIIGIRSSLMHALLQKSIVHKYGVFATRAVINMLTSDNEERSVWSRKVTFPLLEWIYQHPLWLLSSFFILIIFLSCSMYRGDINLQRKDLQVITLLVLLSCSTGI